MKAAEVPDIVMMEVGDLKPAPYNPNKHPDSQIQKLVRSIERFGFTQPILVQKDTLTILAGHARLDAAKKAGLKKVPVIVLPFDEVEAMTYNLADNRVARESVWDFPKVADILVELDSRNGDLLDTGFNQKELENLLVTAHPGSDSPGIPAPRWVTKNSAHVRRISEPTVDEETGEEIPWENTQEPGDVYQEDGTIWRADDTVIFPSLHPWGIPELKEDMLSDLTPSETYRREIHGDDGAGLFVVWGTSWPKQYEGSLIGFYCFDLKLEKLWHDAVGAGRRILKCGCTDVVGPDFSFFVNHPRAFHVWNHYRNMWLARFWQEMGLRVVYNLQYCDMESLEYLLPTRPKHFPVACTQLRTSSSEKEAREHQQVIKEILSNVKIDTLLCYSAPSIFADWVDHCFKPVGQRVQRISPHTETIRTGNKPTG